MPPSISLPDRRAFLGLLAASPLLSAAGFTPRWVEAILAAPLAAQDQVIIKSVREALNVFDFEAAARAKLSVPHFTEFALGVFNDETLRANREAFTRYQIKIRHLLGIGKVDQSVQIFGVRWDAPIFLCPVGRITALNPEGNLAVARAAGAKRTLEIMSGVQQLEQVNALRGQPVWIGVQGGAPSQDLIKRLEAAGTPVLVWAVDGNGGGNQIGARAVQRAGVANLERKDDPRCNSCHQNEGRITLSDSLNDVLGALGSLKGEAGNLVTWEDVKRVRAMTRMKLVLKGIVAREDAELALKNGVDGVIVSNHGAHEDASGRGTLECLPEIVAGVGGKIPVFIDSGFRSGADVFKALALGATAIGIGRAYAWGLASFGQEGVETVIELLRRELQVVMAQTGATSIAKISRASLIARA
jgi:isopentenyl diphosphate isomerase/L-lactate dehydrogenase-like FMN-dependent dehydrogenase